MDDQGFKFTFYVKPFLGNNENDFCQAAGTLNKLGSKTRPVLAQLSNRPIMSLCRPVTHHPANSSISKPMPVDSIPKSLSFFQQSSKFRSSTQKPVSNARLFPVIHYYRKPRGLTPCNILRQKLCL